MQHKNLIDGSRDILHGIQERCQHTGYQARNISHATAEQSSRAARTVRDYAGRKLDEMTEQFNKDLPLIEKGGYTLTGVEIDVGISPQFSCRFSIQDDTTAEQREAALEAAKPHRMAHSILTALNKACDAQCGVRIGNLHLRDIEVVVGALPKVQLRFRNPASTADKPVIKQQAEPPAAPAPPPPPEPSPEPPAEQPKEDSSPVTQWMNSLRTPPPIPSSPPRIPRR